MTGQNLPQEFKLINIREVWPGEAKDFTPWLAENLEALSDHLKIGELELDSTEADVHGGRRLDILATDADGRNWAVENQYGEADHDHLTRALAYAVGLKCRGVIVVAESHRDEFVAVANEWNRYSEAYGSDGIRLFLVAIEAGRIGDSRPGFRFRLVAGPNEWKSETATGARPTSDADRIRYEQRERFWSGLRDAMERNGSLPGPRVSRDNWATIIGRGPFSFQWSVTLKSCRVELRVESYDGAKNDQLYDSLLEHRETIHQALGTNLEWIQNPDHRVNRIYWEPEGACGYRTPAHEREAGYKALVDAAHRFHETLMPYVKDLI
ncbi:MAG: DUF4268 domain-containing protein [bacterium]|nr:DUF4268 domain-containing protein [bacterium]